MKYPGSTGLILRKAYDDVVTKTLPFFEAQILGKQLGQSVVRTGRKHYRYDNGSLLFWGGMWDVPQREAVKGIGLDAGLDWVFFEEATALDSDDFDVVLSRMRGKAAGWNQIILSTNPDAPGHWINQRLIISKLASVYISFYTDNPANPASYKQSMELMTGIQYKRLVLGQWVQAEGAIYDNFDPTHNVTEEAEYNPDLPVRWGVDDGYVYGDGPGNSNYHPRVILFGQPTPQGGLNIFDEYVQAGALAEETLDVVLSEEYPYKEPELASVDSSATELRERIGRCGIMHSGATHKVSEGIKRVRALICDGNGARMIKIHPRCRHTINEMQSYSYDMKSRRVAAGEPTPKKVDDHCPDALRYMVKQL
jgi:phage terminase large subunit